jgi:hypothetical protein
MCSVNQRGHMIRHDKCVHLFEIKPLVVNVWCLFIYYFRYIKSRFSCEFLFSLEVPYLRDTNGKTLFMFIFIISIILHINFVHFFLNSDLPQGVGDSHIGCFIVGLGVQLEGVIN